MKYILFVILTFLLFSCTEENIYNVQEYAPTVVVISDNQESSDIIIQVMGSIRSVHPNANISFVHSKAFDLFEASYHLKVSSDSYPDSTYFITIVEPGAGSMRMVCRGKDGRKYLMPDNGVCSRLVKHDELYDYYYVTDPDVLEGGDYQSLPIEDFYSLATRSLLADIPLQEFGDKFDDPETLEINDPEQKDDIVKGQVLFVNNFGNCHTNIPGHMMTNFDVGDILKFKAGDKTFFAKYGTKYSSVGLNQNVAFVDASFRLKLAVNYGDMGERYGISAGTNITISREKVRVGVLYYNKSSVSEYIANTMKQELNKMGFENDQNIMYMERDAEGDASRLASFADDLVNEDSVDIIVPISTPASQAAVNVVPEDIPIIFTYVTDPKSAGILDVRENVSGLSDATNFKDYLSFVKRLMPDLSLAGRIYNPSESNSAFAQEKLLSLINLYDLNFFSVTISSPDEIEQAYASVTNRSIGAILIAADNTMSQAMSDLTALTNENGIPVIGDSYQHCGDGALASISVNYDSLSISTGDLVGSVILGIDPDDEDVRYFSTDVIAVNTKTAGDIGFDIPQDIIDEAQYVYP